MEPLDYWTRDPRKLAEAGGAKTISEAKAHITRQVYECRLDRSDIAHVSGESLNYMGAAAMRRLARQGLARAMNENSPEWEFRDLRKWVVTKEPWAAEVVR
jgi:hypothetical protein